MDDEKIKALNALCYFYSYKEGFLSIARYNPNGVFSSAEDVVKYFRENDTEIELIEDKDESAILLEIISPDTDLIAKFTKFPGIKTVTIIKAARAPHVGSQLTFRCGTNSPVPDALTAYDILKLSATLAIDRDRGPDKFTLLRQGYSELELMLHIVDPAAEN